MLQLTFLASDAGYTGLDTNPIIMPVQKFGKEFHRTISGLPFQPCIGGAPSERLMMSWWAGEMNLWRIPGYDLLQGQASPESNEFEVQNRKLAARILIQVGVQNYSPPVQSADSFGRVRSRLHLLTWR